MNTYAQPTCATKTTLSIPTLGGLTTCPSGFVPVWKVSSVAVISLKLLHIFAEQDKLAAEVSTGVVFAVRVEKRLSILS
jgi:hypothetical protein